MRLPILAALSLVLAGCSPQADDSQAQADETAVPVEPDGGIGTGATPPGTMMAGPSETAGDSIPSNLHGRWGMTPADCTSTRGDAKGLLTVGPKTLAFYESVGTLERETARSDSMIRGQFGFTGEGMDWTRDVTLAVQGDTLTRSESGGGESSGPFTYTKCAA